MRRILLLYIIFSVIGLTTVHAQFDNGRQRVDENGYDQYGNQVDPAMIPDRLDSANVEVQGLPPKLYMWRINNQLGDRTIIPADTVYHHFQNSNLTEGLTGHYNYLANMGSPRMSRIFFERRDPEPTIFMEPFSSFFIRPTEFNFTNSNVPYTNLTPTPILCVPRSRRAVMPTVLTPPICPKSFLSSEGWTCFITRPLLRNATSAAPAKPATVRPVRRPKWHE